MTENIIVFATCAIVGVVAAYVIRRYEYDNTIDQCESAIMAIRMARLYETLNRAAEYEDAPTQEPPVIDTPNLAEGDGRNETQITR